MFWIAWHWRSMCIYTKEIFNALGVMFLLTAASRFAVHPFGLMDSETSRTLSSLVLIVFAIIIGQVVWLHYQWHKAEKELKREREAL